MRTTTTTTTTTTTATCYRDHLRIISPSSSSSSSSFSPLSICRARVDSWDSHSPAKTSVKTKQLIGRRRDVTSAAAP
ncbi:hypothetical protein E2C01_026176 [Portunus trituberculatus]|uniref:Uncharacterized protein n=1 Tax=Portunus trituberculatus TaxID=210409 RepID=A0A5B7EHH2_PORTR|nr:hypothetical protein [Portunus trituberculatus]